MRKPSAVIDSSCVIALDALDLLPQMAWLFGRLLLPKAVRVELNRRRSTKDRLRALLRDYDFVQPCDEYDQASVDVLVTWPTRAGKKDRGEAEAVVQASSVGAAIIIDEARGRKLAASYSLDLHDTIWILERMHALGIFAPSTVRQHLQELQERKIRIPLKAANEFLLRIGEPILDK